MVSILSFVRKDLRFLLWPWLAWMGLLAARIAHGFWCILAPSGNHPDSQSLDFTLTALGALVCYLLVLRLVQADAPLRPRAFWRTRPISGGGLLAAKALAAFLLFGLAPVLVSLPWWLFNSLAGSDLALAALELVLTHVAIILPAFLLASVVDSFARAVLWSVVQYGAIVGLVLIAGPSKDYLSLLEPGLALSRELLAVGIATMGIVALTVWQFRRRRPVPVIAGFVLLHVAVAVIWAYSPYNFIPSSAIRRPAVWTELNAERYKAVALEPNVAASYYHPKYLEDAFTAPAVVRLQWPVAGLPPDLVPFSRLTALSYVGDQDYVFKRSNAWASTGFPKSWQATRNLLGLPPIKTPEGKIQTPSILIQQRLTLDQAAWIKSHPPRATTTLHLDLYRPRLYQNHPLRPGLKFTDHHEIIRIITLDTAPTTPPGVRIEHSSTKPYSLLRFYIDARRSDYKNPQWSISRKPLYTSNLLLGYTTSELSDVNDLYTDITTPLHILGVEIGRAEQFFHQAQIVRDGKLVPPDIDLATWRAGLRIARITYHEEARLLLTGRSAPLVITGSPEAPPTKLRNRQ